MQDGFTFEGRHLTRDMGCEYYASDPRPIAPAARRNEYAIAGRSGTVIYPGGTWEAMRESGIIVPARGDGEAPIARLRRVAAWLRAPQTGRGKLIWDSRPEVYRMAQIDAAPAAGYQKWPGGALNVTITMQPIARAVQASRQAFTLTGQEAETTLTHHTQLAAPLEIRLRPAGTAAVTAVTLSIDGARIALAGLSLAPGQTLCLSGEEGSAGAFIEAADASAFVTAWADPCARQGAHLRVEQTGGAQISISIAARGCFL